jgi:hypothetical protein
MLIVIQPVTIALTRPRHIVNMNLILNPPTAFSRYSAPIFGALLVGAIVCIGCGKAKKPSAEAPAPSPESVQQAANDHMPVYAPKAPLTPAVTVTPTGDPDLGELNRAMLRWLMRNRRTPASFEEFSASAGVVIPPAPAGKKYIISKDMHILLVKQ